MLLRADLKTAPRSTRLGRVWARAQFIFVGSSITLLLAGSLAVPADIDAPWYYLVPIGFFALQVFTVVEVWNQRTELGRPWGWTIAFVFATALAVIAAHFGHRLI